MTLPAGKPGTHDRVGAYRRGTLKFGREHARSFPWRDSKDPYEILIGEVLLQRTRGENAVPVYETFMRRWPQPEDLERASEEEIAEVIASLGLRKRSPVLRRLGEELAALGRIPSDPGELEALPGVGPYTAHAVPVFASNANLPLVDWVIARVLRRYFGLESTRRPNHDGDLWELAREIVRLGRAREVWVGTLDLAAAVCVRRPACGVCPLRRTCAYAESRSRSA